MTNATPSSSPFSALFSSCWGTAKPGKPPQAPASFDTLPAPAGARAGVRVTDPCGSGILGAAVAAATKVRTGGDLVLLPLCSGERLVTIAAGRDEAGDGALLLHLADAALNHGVVSVGIPVRHEPDPATAPEHRSLAERLLAGGGLATANSASHGEITVTTRAVKPPEGANFGRIDLVVEGEPGSGHRRTIALTLHALPMRRSHQFAKRAREAIEVARRYGAPHRDRSTVRGLALVHDSGMLDRLPGLAALEHLRSGGTVAGAAEAVRAAKQRIGAFRAPRRRGASDVGPLPPSPDPPFLAGSSRRLEPSPTIRRSDPPVLPASTMRVDASPTVRMPRPHESPVSPDARTVVPPPRPDLSMLTELVGRMTAPTGLKGWWRRTFGPKPKPDEVLTLARQLAQPALAQWQARCGTGAQANDAMRVWCRDLLRKAFEESSPRSQKRWAHRAKGSGAFEAARKAQVGVLCRALNDYYASDETISQAYATMAVLDGLRQAIR